MPKYKATEYAALIKKCPYAIELTRSEWKAVKDFVRGRYAWGDALYDASIVEDRGTRFLLRMRESEAWALRDAVDEEGLALAGPALTEKIYALLEAIV